MSTPSPPPPPYGTKRLKKQQHTLAHQGSVTASAEVAHWSLELLKIAAAFITDSARFSQKYFDHCLYASEPLDCVTSTRVTRPYCVNLTLISFKP